MASYVSADSTQTDEDVGSIDLNWKNLDYKFIEHASNNYTSILNPFPDVARYIRHGHMRIFKKIYKI